MDFFGSKNTSLVSLSNRESLTPREIEVLALVAAGQSTKEVAHALGISFRTASCHRARILSKLDAHNTADLTRYAIGVGLLPLRWQQDNGSSMPDLICRRGQELVRAAQDHLRRVVELAHDEIEAVNSRNQEVWTSLNKQIINEVGEKSRSLAALHQHRKDHGC